MQYQDDQETNPDVDLTIKSAASQCMRTDGVDYSSKEIYERILKHQNAIQNIFIKIDSLGTSIDPIKKAIYYGKLESPEYSDSYHHWKYPNFGGAGFQATVNNARIIHGVIGIMTELAEIAKPFSISFYSNTNIDWINVQEELGDIFWYLALLLDEVSKRTDEPIDEPIHMVINKLKVRYPEKFLETKALERNLEGERVALEESREDIIKRNEDELNKLAAEDLVSAYNEKGN